MRPGSLLARESRRSPAPATRPLRDRIQAVRQIRRATGQRERCRVGCVRRSHARRLPRTPAGRRRHRQPAAIGVRFVAAPAQLRLDQVLIPGATAGARNQNVVQARHLVMRSVRRLDPEPWDEKKSGRISGRRGRPSRVNCLSPFEQQQPIQSRRSCRPCWRRTCQISCSTCRRPWLPACRPPHPCFCPASTC